MSDDDSDDEERYEVERILAEKHSGGHGKPVFLIKWKGYKDEECTWEPEENFDSPEMLHQWRQQKANGDTLDDSQVQELQVKMDLFMARTDETSDNDVEFVEERPKKRAKVVSDAPLVSKRGMARPLSRSASPRKGNPRRSVSMSPQPASKTSKRPAAPPLHKPTRKADATKSSSKTAAPPLHTPKPIATPSRNPLGSNATKGRRTQAIQVPRATVSSSTSTPKSPIRPAPIAVPAEFHAPDVRTRAPNNTETAAKRNLTGQVFRNYRQLNNARKKQREEAPPAARAGTTFAPTGEPTTVRAEETSKATHVVEKHASALFFSEDEDGDDDEKEQEGHQQVVAPANQIKPPEQGLADHANQQTKSVNRQSKSPTPVVDGGHEVQAAVGDSSAQKEKDTALSPSTRVATDRMSHSTQEVSAAHEPQATSSEPVDLAPRPRRNSLFNRSLPPDVVSTLRGGDTEKPQQAQTSPRQPSKPLFIPVAAPPSPGRPRVDDSPRPPPRSVSEAVLPTSPRQQTEPVFSLIQLAPQQYSVQGQSGMPTAAARDFVSSQSNVVRAAFYGGTREWRKGDIVLDLHVSDLAVNGIKLLHVLWEYGKSLVALKGRQVVLPIRFDQTLYRFQYEFASKARWFSYFAIGAVEPFPETIEQLAYLADYLEKNDCAALFQHPTEDMMLVLYSCKAASWQDLGHKPVRYGDSRVHIAFRQRYRADGPSVETLQSIVDQARRIELDQEDERGREAARRASTIDKREETKRERSRSWSQIRGRPSDFQDSRRERSRSRVSVATRDPRREAKGRTSRRPSVTLSETSHGAQHPQQLAPSPSLQSPGKQLMSELQMNMSPHFYGAGSDDAMDIDVPSRRTSIALPADTLTSNTTRSAQRTERMTASSSFPGLDRGLKEFAWTPDAQAVDKDSVFVILVYELIEPERVERLKAWLTEQGLPKKRILENTTKGHWADFSKRINTNTCVMLVDKKYPVYNLENLAKLLESDNLVCWEIDYLAKSEQPIAMTKLFPRGTAMAIPEGCFLNEPSHTLWFINWLNRTGRKPYSSSKLILPPGIDTVLQDQADLSRQESTKKVFLDTALLLRQMADMNDGGASDSGFDDIENSLNFSVLTPSWSAVYKDIPEGDERLPALLHRKKEEEKDQRMMAYFGAWAARHLEDHRTFMVLTINAKFGEKPKNYEHVRVRLVKGYAEKLQREEAKSGSARSRSRVRTGSAMLTPRS